MKTQQLFVIILALTVVVSCKKSTLVEQVDVPVTPLEVVKVKEGTSNATDVKAVEGAFKMYELPYTYKALEPNFDATTLEIHYSKHHLGYVNNLNKVIIGTKYETLALNDIFKNLNLSDTEIRNNAGGFYNHNLFWGNMAANAGGEPEGDLLEAIIRDFGSFDGFRTQFTEASLKVFGSGWAWLVSDKYGKLRIITTPNNDNPLMKNLGFTGIPLLNLDLWEHAYYLKFQNKKREYVNTFFSVINWNEVLKKYDAFPKVTSSFVAPTVTTETAVPDQAKETVIPDEFKK
ncbi:superoxide dismutase [Flavobacterium psychrophilum]|uniref:superoxide dismutase n=1 Tax=Flavobacterium psychrophilum TaxID=96345 RepID=UPI0004D16AED|nr:superoxide dismutase [Flavobacterium psychrophilum]AIG29512.1 superoxide dismutase [Flavobacterium psychrophilum]AIG31789.1 superoxide dismutase [Flavobacterium psychrophilum]AIG33943.1 superoxide dismutase [Flavobacterium psychrophilum]AIG36306.1 superoxide dismutase [Flavobacterium psychrophilum]AIG38572.1 superoxide dismutase [Flavobacterium psychrophilum]